MSSNKGDFLPKDKRNNREDGSAIREDNPQKKADRRDLKAKKTNKQNETKNIMSLYYTSAAILAII